MSMNELMIDLRTIALCAVVAYGLVEICKPVLEIMNIRKGQPVFKLAMRITALVVGCLVGTFLHVAINPEASRLLGGVLGACSGALNALIIGLIKKKSKGLVNDSSK